jgi:hypothetical protein
MNMGKMVFVICNCRPFNLTTFNAKEREENGYIKSTNPHFDYERKDKCGVCDSTVYLKTGYSKRWLQDYGAGIIASKLQEKAAIKYVA